MLTLVATPIGNREDISPRALKALSEVDFILCEDTRRSAPFLQHHGIKKKLISYHSFKEASALRPILEELKAGKKGALISDAGTPCINDPGALLVKTCIEEKISLDAIPGPCSLIQALILSGMSAERFQSVGFLPRGKKKELQKLLCYPGTTIALESPDRIVKTLKAIEAIDPKRALCIAREMTKMFQEYLRGTAKELISHFAKELPRGEMVLLIAEGSVIETLDLEEIVALCKELHGLSTKEAIKMAAKLTGAPKRDVYAKTQVKE